MHAELTAKTPPEMDEITTKERKTEIIPGIAPKTPDTRTIPMVSRLKGNTLFAMLSSTAQMMPNASMMVFLTVNCLKLNISMPGTFFLKHYYVGIIHYYP